MDNEWEQPKQEPNPFRQSAKYAAGVAARVTAGFIILSLITAFPSQSDLLVVEAVSCFFVFVICTVYATIVTYSYLSKNSAYRLVAWLVTIPTAWVLVWTAFVLNSEYRFPEKVGKTPFHTKGSFDFILLSGILAMGLVAFVHFLSKRLLKDKQNTK